MNLLFLLAKNNSNFPLFLTIVLKTIEFHYDLCPFDG